MNGVNGKPLSYKSVLQLKTSYVGLVGKLLALTCSTIAHILVGFVCSFYFILSIIFFCPKFMFPMYKSVTGSCYY